MQAYKTKSGVTQYKPAFDELTECIEGDNCEGWCLACGASQSGCEPDAQRYTCEGCGAAKVYGAEELMLMGLHH
jgi:Zn finger protein HypA/HybF involved in hydrogenase expression